MLAGTEVNDSIVIEADITTFDKLQSTVEKAATPTSTLQADVSSLLTDSASSDVTILLQQPDSSDCSSDRNSGRTFQAHSTILKARSPYFRAMLSSPMVESATLQITEHDIEPAVFQEVLCFLYTDSLSDGAPEALGEWLLLAANKYGLLSLKQLCEDLSNR